METVIIKHLRKIAKSSDPEKTKELFIELKGLVIETFKDETEKVILEYFDCIAWIDSKIEGLSYAEAIIKNRNSKR